MFSGDYARYVFKERSEVRKDGIGLKMADFSQKSLWINIY